jgi:hypothetical protein
MTLNDTATGPSYTNRDCAIAALAGAVANGASLGFLWPGAGAGSFVFSPVYFAIGYAVLVFAGRWMACRLAVSGRDTLMNGALIGAAVGWLAGAFVFGALVLIVSGSLWVAFTPFTPIAGLFFGFVDGGVAGVALIWFGRRGPALNCS